jgi:hypothetical protein
MSASSTSPQELAELAVVGVARNCSRSLRHDIARLQAATRGLQARVHFLIVESDSDDGSEAALAALQQDMADFRYLSLGSLRAQIPQRTARIAHCRNRYLDELRDNPLYARVSHVLVSDLDGVSRDLDAQALASCWRPGLPPWGALTANQGDYYYDIYALRHPVWCPGDCWQEQRALLPQLGKRAADEIALFSRMVHIDPRRPPIEVDSAFGGLAVYRRDALLGARYVGLDAQGQETCEHVQLHAQMRAHGWRIFINPALINAHSTKHAGRKKFWRTWRRRLWNRLRGKSDL